nr:SDR family NAD(P)-dependent oxidoreductase [Acidovorax sp. sic0104]
MGSVRGCRGGCWGVDAVSNATRRIVIVGATSAMAEHCARLWVQAAPVDLTLVGRDHGRMERVAADLRVRSPRSRIGKVCADFLNPLAIRATVDGIARQGAVDIVLIAHGSLPEQPACQEDLSACSEALRVNGVSPVLFAEAFAEHMARQGRGTLALIGSVAGDRGRRTNYVYGAAKGLLARYAEGLQHRFAGTAVRVVLVKPGPTDTPMTAHLKAQGVRLAGVEQVARQVVAAIEAGKPLAYVPGRWRWIMVVIRHLPRAVFHRMKI